MKGMALPDLPRFGVLGELVGAIFPNGLEHPEPCLQGGSLLLQEVFVDQGFNASPRAVIDYLIVHETSHLRHLDHSPRFWKTVSTLCPDYKKHKDWLNLNGHKLWTTTR
jgi:hypothetical protein